VGPTFQVTFDANDVPTLVAFWAAVLGYVEQPPPEGSASWQDWAREHGIPEETWDDQGALIDPDGSRPRLYFQRVPEPKTAKNRVHLDVNVGAGLRGEERRTRVRDEAARVETLGATRRDEVDKGDEYWIVMHDPEGNEFCLQ
jgi:hypothetical protein